MDLGTKVYFVAVKPKKCVECKSKTADLEYFMETGYINDETVFTRGVFPRVKICDCERDCLCSKVTDYTQEPTQTEEIKAYTVYVEKESLFLKMIPEEALQFTEDEIKKQIKDKMFVMPVMVDKKENIK